MLLVIVLGRRNGLSAENESRLVNELETFSPYISRHEQANGLS